MENGGCIKVQDLDGDFLPDIFTITPGCIPVYYKNLGLLQFDEATTIPLEYTDVFQQFRLADFEGDGDIDIAANWCGSESECHILINDGEGNFGEQFAFLGDSGFTFFSVGDVNQDNYTDILITTSDPCLYYNIDFNFTPIIIDENYWSHPWLIDMNQDQFIDIVFNDNYPSFTKLFFNNGTGEFNDSQLIDMPTQSIIRDVGDYNNDGFPDFALQIESNPNVYICFNENNSAISEPIMYPFGLVPFSFKVESGDFDGNGYLDLVVTSYIIEGGFHGVSVLFNDGSGNFLENPQVDARDEIIFPELIQLYNYPNPFNPKTRIEFELHKSFRNPTLFIYNIKGHIIDIIPISSDQNSLIWDASGNPSGVYLYQIKADNYESEVNKMGLIK